MNDSRTSEMAPLGNSNRSPIFRKQLSQPVPDQEKSDDQNSHEELLRCTTRLDPVNQRSQRHDDGQPLPRISIFSLQEPDPPKIRLRYSKKDCATPKPERGIAGENAWQPESGPIHQHHDPFEGLKLGAGTGPKRFSLMVKSASEAVDRERATGSPV